MTPAFLRASMRSSIDIERIVVRPLPRIGANTDARLNSWMSSSRHSARLHPSAARRFPCNSCDVFSVVVRIDELRSVAGWRHFPPACQSSYFRTAVDETSSPRTAERFRPIMIRAAFDDARTCTRSGSSYQGLACGPETRPSSRAFQTGRARAPVQDWTSTNLPRVVPDKPHEAPRAPLASNLPTQCEQLANNIVLQPASPASLHEGERSWLSLCGQT